jgi:hypothetical protein
MSTYSAQQLAKLAGEFYEAVGNLEKTAAKKKEKKKLDPKAKLRNRGTVCVPASSAKDKKDHFPINDADQARNALARVHQYNKVPSWFKGSLKGLQALVNRKVHSKYPSIGKETKKKSSMAELMAKYGQVEKIQWGDPDAAAPIPAVDPALGDQPPPLNPPPASNAPAEPAPGKPAQPKINPVFQVMLGVNPDGIFGQTTQGSLNTYKRSLGLATMTNQQAFEFLKKEPAFASKTMMPFDEASGMFRSKQTLVPR